MFLCVESSATITLQMIRNERPDEEKKKNETKRIIDAVVDHLISHHLNVCSVGRCDCASFRVIFFLCLSDFISSFEHISGSKLEVNLILNDWNYGWNIFIIHFFFLFFFFFLLALRIRIVCDDYNPRNWYVMYALRACNVHALVQKFRRELYSYCTARTHSAN